MNYSIHTFKQVDLRKKQTPIAKAFLVSGELTLHGSKLANTIVHIN